jgi:hypothetical protein
MKIEDNYTKFKILEERTVWSNEILPHGYYAYIKNEIHYLLKPMLKYKMVKGLNFSTLPI